MVGIHKPKGTASISVKVDSRKSIERLKFGGSRKYMDETDEKI
jgi:hypothetical protein